MERNILLFSFLFAFSFSCPLYARLGETPIQFADRYGSFHRSQIQPTIFPPLLRDSDIRIYTKNRWVITAAFLEINSGAVRLTYRKERNKTLSKEEIAELLKANSNGGTWRKAVIPKDPEKIKALKDVSEGLFRAMLGQSVWIRDDGATAHLTAPFLIQFNHLDAYAHEKRLDSKRVQKERDKRPNF